MMIDGPVNLAVIRRMLHKADRTHYMKQDPAQRKKCLAAYKKCSEDEKEMPKRGQIAFDLVKFGALYKLIEDSLPVTEKERAEEFSIAITQILTARPVRLGDVVGLVRVDPTMVIFNPQHPSLSPVLPEEEEGDDGYSNNGGS